MTEQEMLVKIELDKYFDNVCAVFGILGNIKAESNCRGNNLQNSFESKLGFTDETYTKALNDGSYTCDQFQNDHAGYGLCQWTYWSRKKALYEFWQLYMPYEGIDSVIMQAAFIHREMSMTLKSKLEACQTVEEAARIFMLEYEKPANQTEENITKRCEIARDLYTDYLQTKDEEEEENENDIMPVVPVHSYGDYSVSLERIANSLDKINWNLATLTETIMEIKKKL